MVINFTLIVRYLTNVSQGSELLSETDKAMNESVDVGVPAYLAFDSYSLVILFLISMSTYVR